MKVRLFIFFHIFFICNSLYSQLDTVHWLPPMHSRSNTQAQDHYLYLSTPITTPFTVTIRDGAGNVLATPTLSNATPVRYDIGNGTQTHIMVRRDSLNRALTSRGLIVSAPYEFYCNFRVRVTSHAASHTTKGQVAKGHMFRYGAIPSSDTTNTNNRNFFLGIIATEDSTFVMITNYDTSVVFADPISDITDDTLTFWLNEGESYVISGYHGTGTNNYGFIGALITSTNPIVCNIGNWLGGLAPENHDIAAEQIMPVDKIGNDYVIVAGRGTHILERPIVVAHYNNTQVFVNGNSVPEVVLNAGEYYVIPHDLYIGGVHKNMYIQTTQPSYVYQVLGGSSSLATMGFMFIPPANCNLPNFVDQMPDIHLIGTVVFEGDVFIVTTTGATVTFNGTTLTGAQSVTGFPWVTYKLMNQTGHAIVESTMPATIGFMGASGAAGYGSYYSGFHEYIAVPPSNNIEICQGNDLQLNVSGGVSYNWSGPNGFNSTQQNPVVSNIPLSGAGQYYVTVTYSNGCEDVFISNITVNPLPNPIAVNDGPVCFGNNLALSVQSFVSYEWSGPNGFTSNIQSPVINNISFAQGGNYTVTVTDNKGCQNSSQTNVIINPLPVVSFYTTSPQCANANITLNALGGVSYQWTGPNNFTSANANNTLTSVSSNQMGYYKAIVTDNNGCINEDSIFIVVNNNPLITHTMQHISCYGLSDGAITVYPFNGAFPYFFEWSTIPAQTTQTASGLSPNITYSVMVADNNGCTVSEDFMLTQPPPLQITSLNVQDALCYNTCDGVASVTVTGGTLPYAYSWSPPGTGGNVSSLNTLCEGTYQLIITDSNNCNIDTNFIINHPNILSYTYTVNHVLCFNGNDGQLEVNADGGTSPYTYQWSPAVSNDSVATNLQAGTYQITLSDNHQCDTVIQVMVEQPPLLVINTSGNDTVCIGQTFTISSSAIGGVTPYTFTWNNNLGTGESFSLSDSLTTIYQVFVTDSHNCVSDTMTLEIFVHPVVEVHAFYLGDSAICLNNSTQISALGTGGNGGPYTYTWSEGIGLQSPPVQVTPIQTTQYYVTVADNCGSPVGIDSITIIIHPLPDVIFSSHINEGCEPLLVNFFDESTPDIATWQWHFGDPISGSSNTSALQNPSHLYINPGTYNVTLTATTIHGCVGIHFQPAMINVYPLPVAKFSHYPYYISVDNPLVFFTDKSTGAAHWFWNFGDAASGSQNTSNLQNTIHNYTEPGQYIITLFVTTDKGCVDSTSGIVTYLPEYTFYMPNAFTPDGDGLNDFFGPFGLGFDTDEYFFQIYDRWGKVIYETNDINKPWDGTVLKTGNLAPFGVYTWSIYFIRTNDNDKHRYRKSGHVTLIRKK